MPSGRSSAVKLSDKLLYALFVLAAVALDTLSFCSSDWLWAITTVAVVLVCAFLLRHRCQKGVPDAPEKERS